MTVKLRPIELDVLVDGKVIGKVYDCGDCWRAFLSNRRRKPLTDDYDSQEKAVNAVLHSLVRR
jgi:hypothetical protein